MTFQLDHLSLVKGWRPKTEVFDNFTIEPDGTEVVHTLDLDDEEVLAGWGVAFAVVTTSDQLVFEAIVEPPGADGDRRTGSFKIEDQLNAGQTEAQVGVPTVEETIVDGVTLYTLTLNAFGSSYGLTVRFPEFGRIELRNPSDSTITVNQSKAVSFLLHRPELFFKQIRAYNALTAQTGDTQYISELETAEQARQYLDMNDEVEEAFIDAIRESPS